MGNIDSQIRELHLIEALLEILSYRTGDSHKIVYKPDFQDRNNEACDAIAELGNCRLAIDHTSIQCMPDQIAYSDRFRKITQPIVKELNGMMPKPRTLYPNI
jgi:hypothetical protein